MWATSSDRREMRRSDSYQRGRSSGAWPRDYLASPVAGDGKIYVTGENGFIVVLSQGPTLNILAKNDMGEPCIATPAIADGRLRRNFDVLLDQ